MYVLVHPDNLQHAVVYVPGILIRNVSSYAQFAVITAADIGAYYQLAFRIQVLDSLGQYQEQASGIGAHAAKCSDIHELDVLGVVESVIHALYLVVNSGAHGTVLHTNVATVVQLMQCSAVGYTDNRLGITAADFDVLWHGIG